MFGFEPNQKQTAEFQLMFEQNGDTLNFNESINLSFRLLSKEYDKPGIISLARVKEVLTEMGITDLGIV